MREHKLKIITLLLLGIAGGAWLYFDAKHSWQIKRFAKKIFDKSVKPTQMGTLSQPKRKNPVKGHSQSIKNAYQTHPNYYDFYLRTLHNKAKQKTYIPKMVTIPAGKFLMGCQSDTCSNHRDELPVREVSIKSFEMAATEVTFEQWDICVAMKGCSVMPIDMGWGRGQMPLVHVSWEQMANEFIPWLNANSEGGYRLPTEAEWEYAARGGKVGKMFPWGNEPVSCDKNSPYGVRFGATWNAEQKINKDRHCKGVLSPMPVGSFTPTSWGLYDILGNVAEFTQDCRNSGNYIGAPTDGSAWQDENCDRRMRRGTTWTSPRSIVRISTRRAYLEDNGYNRVGFRLVRDLSK